MSKKKIATGPPGIRAKWTSSAKDGMGKPINTASQVVFTLSHGILNEVYFPREDVACIRDMGFIVTDGEDFFSEEKRHTHHDVQLIKEGIPAYRITNACEHKRYKIVKEIVADPFRNTVLQQIEFTSEGKVPYHLFVLLAPHLNDQGNHNTAWVGDYNGIPMLFAGNENLYLALACSSGWGRRSVGFVGTSDGWMDLHQHKEMLWEYTHAEDGNVALTGEIDLSKGEHFVLATGFGSSPSEAANHALSSILDGFGSAKKWYIEEWDKWFHNLHNLEGRNFKISAAVLRMHEAKTFPGGVIASMSIPWGNEKGDEDKGGYHLVWPRDLVESSGGFLALKTKDDALRILNYLMSTQSADGSWPQNMWLSGEAYWHGVQMDQTALPLLLIDKCMQNNAIDKERMERYWPVIKKAISFLVIHGPYTQQDRWEEENGFTPFTVAAVISGLLVAADLAEINNDKDLAAYCRETADSWNDQIETWLYVSGTTLAKENGAEGYYIRLNPYDNVSAEELGSQTIDLKNHKPGEGRIMLKELISVDALALVRFGLRNPNDKRILDTIKVIDAKLKVETPNGPSWHRYNNDGYGEDEYGNGYNNTGIGRAWPLLTGERAHYEVAAGNIDSAIALLHAMDAFSNNGLLSEQIWDTGDIPEKGLFLGRPSGSAMPLTWTHAEYIKLCASIQDRRVFDMPRQTQERYLNNDVKSPYSIWRFSNQSKSIPSGKTLRIEVFAEAIIHWTDDNWESIKETETRNTGVGLFTGDVPVEDKSVLQIEFTFFWKENENWENRNFVVKVEREVGVLVTSNVEEKVTF
jgi:glucoamylase